MLSCDCWYFQAQLLFGGSYVEAGAWCQRGFLVTLSFFFRWFWKKKIITNSYFTFFFMFICQNVGNLKGFLLVYLLGLYLITLSSYSSTGRGTSYSNNKKIKSNTCLFNCLSGVLVEGLQSSGITTWNSHI